MKLHYQIGTKIRVLKGFLDGLGNLLNLFEEFIIENESPLCPGIYYINSVSVPISKHTVTEGQLNNFCIVLNIPVSPTGTASAGIYTGGPPITYPLQPLQPSMPYPKTPNSLVPYPTPVPLPSQKPQGLDSGEAIQQLKELYAKIDQFHFFSAKPLVCECGCSSIGISKHSSYCPLWSKTDA